MILLLGCGHNQSENQSGPSEVNTIRPDVNISYKTMVNGFHQPPNVARMKSYTTWRKILLKK